MDYYQLLINIWQMWMTFYVVNFNLLINNY